MKTLRRDPWGRRGDILPVQDSLREDTKANLPVEIIDHKPSLFLIAHEHQIAFGTSRQNLPTWNTPAIRPLSTLLLRESVAAPNIAKERQDITYNIQFKIMGKQGGSMPRGAAHQARCSSMAHRYALDETHNAKFITPSMGQALHINFLLYLGLF